MPTLESRLQAAMTEAIQKHSDVKFSLAATRALQDMALKSAANVADMIPKDIPDEDQAVELAKGRFEELISSALLQAASTRSTVVDEQCVAFARKIHGLSWPFIPGV